MKDTQTEQQEIADSVKLEASSLSPQEDARARALYQKVLDGIISDYGEFIPQSIKENPRHIIGRIITVENVPEIIKIWDPPVLEAKANIAKAAYFRDSKVIVMSNQKAWENLSDEEKSYLRQRFGSPEDLFNVYISLYRIGHELAHSISAKGLPEKFEEIGADYYGTEYTRGMFPGPGVDFLSDDTHARLDFYQKLIDTHGDNVHRVFFGTGEPITRTKILRELDQSKVKALHPQRTWLHKQPKAPVTAQK